jgi:hypothetical protein
MANQNIRMHGPTQVSTAAATKYTAPAGAIATLQHIHVQNPSASGVTFTLSIGADVASSRIYDAYTIGAGQTLDVFCKYVLNAGEVIQAFAGTTNVLVMTLDGQVTPALSASDYATVYEADFRLMPTLSMQAAGSYSIDGKTWWAKGPAKTNTTWGVVNEIGIQFAIPVSPPGPPNNGWRSNGNNAWAERVLVFPLAQLPGYNPLAPLALLWRATGLISAGAGEAAISAGLADAALTTASLTGPEVGSSMTINPIDASNSYIQCSPNNNSVDSQWIMTMTTAAVPPTLLDSIEQGIIRFAPKRYFPLARRFTGALGGPNTANEFALSNTSLVRSGNGQSDSPCFLMVAQSPFSGVRDVALTHLKVMQPKSG